MPALTVFGLFVNFVCFLGCDPSSSFPVSRAKNFNRIGVKEQNWPTCHGEAATADSQAWKATHTEKSLSILCHGFTFCVRGEKLFIYVLFGALKLYGDLKSINFVLTVLC